MEAKACILAGGQSGLSSLCVTRIRNRKNSLDTAIPLIDPISAPCSSRIEPVIVDPVAVSCREETARLGETRVEARVGQMVRVDRFRHEIEPRDAEPRRRLSPWAHILVAPRNRAGTLQLAARDTRRRRRNVPERLARGRRLERHVDVTVLPDAGLAGVDVRKLERPADREDASCPRPAERRRRCADTWRPLRPLVAFGTDDVPLHANFVLATRLGRTDDARQALRLLDTGVDDAGLSGSDRRCGAKSRQQRDDDENNTHGGRNTLRTRHRHLFRTNVAVHGSSLSVSRTRHPCPTSRVVSTLTAAIFEMGFQRAQTLGVSDSCTRFWILRLCYRLRQSEVDRSD